MNLHSSKIMFKNEARKQLICRSKIQAFAINLEIAVSVLIGAVQCDNMDSFKFFDPPLRVLSIKPRSLQLFCIWRLPSLMSALRKAFSIKVLFHLKITLPI